MELELADARRGFKVRSAGIAIRDGRVLLHSMPGRDYWMAPGGGVRFGETAREALVREMREELAVEATVGRLLWVVEHFFQSSRRRRHQIAWFHEISLPGDCGAVLREAWQVQGEEGLVTFRWVPFAELATMPLLPGFLSAAIADLPTEPRHLVHVDPAR